MLPLLSTCDPNQAFLRIYAEPFWNESPSSLSCLLYLAFFALVYHFGVRQSSHKIVVYSIQYLANVEVCFKIIRHKRKVLTSQLNGTVADTLGNQQIVRYFATSPREVDHVVRDRLEIARVAEQEVDILQRESTMRQIALLGA